MKPMFWCACAALLLPLASAQAVAQVQEFQFNPVADTTIFADVAGVDLRWDDVSDGVGQSLWLGTTAGGVVRRSLLRFDLSSLPQGLNVLSASLTLFESRSRADQDVTLHRLTAGWGEGTSDGGSQGEGAQATAGDATWRWRDYGVTEWAQRGGDFAATASASLFVGPPNQTYTWSAPGMASDVTRWLADPSQNHGWILIGSEIDAQTAKRFDSRHSPFIGGQPLLTLQVSPVPEPHVWALMAVGSVLVAAQARRRRQG